jgi:hypothetical protein
MEINSLKSELKINFSDSLKYGRRKFRHRIEMRIKRTLFLQLQKRFKLGGHFGQNVQLERSLNLPKSHIYSDGLRVNLSHVQFRMVKPKDVELFNGESGKTLPRLIVRYERMENMVVDEN